MRIRKVLPLLAALVLLVHIVPSFANNMEISATVPNEHTVTVRCSAGGKASVNGTEYTGDHSFTVSRFDSFTVEAAPNQGYILHTITGDSINGLSISGSTATLNSVCGDTTLRIIFVLPTPSPSPSPTITPTPSPSPSPTITPTPSPSPSPTFTPSPSPTPVEGLDEMGNRLYNEYLGVQGGAGDLCILFDKEYEPDDYQVLVENYPSQALDELLPDTLTEEERERALDEIREELPNTVRVVAKPDLRETEDGDEEIVTDEAGNPVYSQRNLLLNGAQIAKLEDRALEVLVLENGAFDVALPLQELCEDRIAKLLVLLYEQGEEALAQGLDAEALDELPEVSTWQTAPADVPPQLTYDMFADAQLEVQLTPVTGDETTAAAPGEFDSLTAAERSELAALAPASPVYRAKAYISVRGVKAEITPLLRSIKVSVSARALIAKQKEALLLAGTPEQDLETLARERLLSRVTLAMINDAFDIHEGYVPGMYTTHLLTTLEDGLRAEEIAQRVLEQLPDDRYAVQIIPDSATETALDLRTNVQSTAAREPEYRLCAQGTSGGLYLAIEHPQ